MASRELAITPLPPFSRTPGLRHDRGMAEVPVLLLLLAVCDPSRLAHGGGLAAAKGVLSTCSRVFTTSRGATNVAAMAPVGVHEQRKRYMHGGNGGTCKGNCQESRWEKAQRWSWKANWRYA